MKDAPSLPIAVFEHAEKRIRKAPWFDEHWVCKTGIWWPNNPKGVVLKLQKTHWSNDGRGEIANDAKIVFSVWTDEKDPGLLRYNIHAFKLRNLRGYKLESRKFANSFRASFPSLRQQWPNPRMDFGPQTLVEGFQKAPADACEDLVVEWTVQFPPSADLIDTLLSKAKISRAATK